ncbi:MAG: class I SAM-dependent methyltransferase [Chloroflexi bacterium]|nr:class I SAM-dependent methyltransferase [Chloroflexota bacterium]
MPAHLPLMYTDIAEWFTSLTAPEDYEEEAAVYHAAIQQHAHGLAVTMLELGAGAGNNATHLKQHYTMTLVDLSAQMSAESRKQNPECEHIVGDMRKIRLGREFDVVFIHDAVMYMTSAADLERALTTAAAHCRAGGLVLVVPDFTKESFAPSTGHGGHDHPRPMRYLEWTWEPEPGADTFMTDYVYMLRMPDGTVRTVHDRHVCGVFDIPTWLAAFEAAGLRAARYEVAALDSDGTPLSLFMAHK